MWRVTSVILVYLAKRSSLLARNRTTGTPRSLRAMEQHMNNV